MDKTLIKEQLIAILSQIQVESGLKCPPLTGSTKPIDTLPKFDSMIWPVATADLATKIGAPIPNEMNIFINETTKRPRSIDETATVVSELTKKQNGMEKVTP